MTPAAARRIVALSGGVVAAVAVAGLVVFGGPAAGRSSERDARRHADLQAITEALACHAEAGATPAAPTALAGISAVCLAPGRAAELVDPRTGAAYPLDHPEPGAVRICAGFERPSEVPPWAPPNFDALTGCLTALLPQPRRN